MNVDPAKWQHAPFGADRDGGYIYGRGTIDDKDNVTAGLMTMLTLKRDLVPLDRDVIFLAESGEEGNAGLGIEYVVNEHFDAIDAEYCLAEGGGVDARRRRGALRRRGDGARRFRTASISSRTGRRATAPCRCRRNAIAHLARAVAAVTDWQPPVVLNDTTRAYFARLAEIAEPELAQPLPRRAEPRSEGRRERRRVAARERARYASMLRTSVSPNIFQGGYRNNVIPSEAKATLDVRFVPGDNYDAFLAEVERVVADPAIDVVFNHWPPTSTGKPRVGGISPIDNGAFARSRRR